MARRHALPRARLVTLTSDVGAAYAAQMKGRLVDSLPPGRIIDLVHDLPPHGVGEAAFVLRAMATKFPPGTVHVVVVDPGVGGARAPIVIECRDDSRLVGPDNGVLIPLAETLGVRAAYRIDPRTLGGLPRVGTTFDGRDVFAPAAALLATGTPPRRLGPRVVPHRYSIPQPEKRLHGAHGEVVHVDRFGNLITNVPTDWLSPAADRIGLWCGRARGRRLRVVPSYEAAGAGHLGVLGSSFGSIELFVSGGRADRRLGARVGSSVRFRWPDGPRTG